MCRPVLEVTAWAWVGLAGVQVLSLSGAAEQVGEHAVAAGSAGGHVHASAGASGGGSWFAVVGSALMLVAD